MVDQATLDWAQSLYQTTSRSFADYYVAYAQAHMQDFVALAEEVRNIFTAIGLCGDLEAWSGVVEIVQAIDDFLDAQGYWQELVAAYNVAIESADNYFWSQGRNPEPDAWHNRIVLRSSLSALHFRRGEYSQARHLVEEALRQSRRIQHRKLEALTLGALGNIAMAQGRYDEAERLQAQSYAVLEQSGETKSIADALHRQAIIAGSRGDLERAWQLESERLTVVRRPDQNDEVAEVLCELGDLGDL